MVHLVVFFAQLIINIVVKRAKQFGAEIPVQRMIEIVVKANQEANGVKIQFRVIRLCVASIIKIAVSNIIKFGVLTPKNVFLIFKVFNLNLVVLLIMASCAL